MIGAFVAGPESFKVCKLHCQIELYKGCQLTGTSQDMSICFFQPKLTNSKCLSGVVNISLFDLPVAFR